MRTCLPTFLHTLACPEGTATSSSGMNSQCGGTPPESGTDCWTSRTLSSTCQDGAPRMQEGSKMGSRSISTGLDQDPESATVVFPGTLTGHATRGKRPTPLTTLLAWSELPDVGVRAEGRQSDRRHFTSVSWSTSQSGGCSAPTKEPQELPQRRGCRNEEQADLLLMVPRDNEGEGLGLCIIFARTSTLRPSMSLERQSPGPRGACKAGLSRLVRSRKRERSPTLQCVSMSLVLWARTGNR